MQSDLAAFGAPVDIQNIAAAEPQQFEVWEDNATTLHLFLKLQTQWAMSNGVVTGLNYQSISFLFTIHNVEKPAEVMDDLQAMEAAVLAELHDKG